MVDIFEYKKGFPATDFKRDNMYVQCLKCHTILNLWNCINCGFDEGYYDHEDGEVKCKKCGLKSYYWNCNCGCKNEFEKTFMIKYNKSEEIRRATIEANELSSLERRNDHLLAIKSKIVSIITFSFLFLIIMYFILARK